MSHMKVASVRDLRNGFPRIEAWLQDGETVSIRKRGRVIATLVPADGMATGTPGPAKPDILSRLRRRWGGRVFSTAEVEAMRMAEVEGEEG